MMHYFLIKVDKFSSNLMLIKYVWLKILPKNAKNAFSYRWNQINSLWSNFVDGWRHHSVIGNNSTMVGAVSMIVGTISTIPGRNSISVGSLQ
jgi:Gpi18-like mannosyltransferase